MRTLPDPRDSDSYDLISLSGNTLLVTHPSSVCLGQPCPVHHPSDHHMASWPLHWNYQRRLMGRFCEHKRWHPDPDSVAYGHSVGSTDSGRHTCDGCCI
jgi:hypothetical protein